MDSIFSAIFEKLVDSSDGAILIFIVTGCRLPVAAGNRQLETGNLPWWRLLDDGSLFPAADDDGDRIAGAHRRAAKRKLSNDYAIADSRIRFELHSRYDQSMTFEVRPDLIERVIDHVGHDVRGRGRSGADEQRNRRLRRHEGTFRRT